MANIPIGRPFEILLVEDNPGDVRLIRVALRDSEYNTNVTVVEDGLDALALLRGEEGWPPTFRPHLILLDLNLPKMNGREFLAAIKSDDDLGRIPVVVLTSSQDEADVLAVYDLQASSFVSKPLDEKEFDATLMAVQSYWIRVARVPDPRQDVV
jgi:two-component system response regulator